MKFLTLAAYGLGYLLGSLGAAPEREQPEAEPFASSADVLEALRILNVGLEVNAAGNLAVSDRDGVLLERGWARIYAHADNLVALLREHNADPRHLVAATISGEEGKPVRLGEAHVVFKPGGYDVVVGVFEVDDACKLRSLL